jgi:hypothetical protein
VGSKRLKYTYPPGFGEAVVLQVEYRLKWGLGADGLVLADGDEDAFAVRDGIVWRGVAIFAVERFAIYVVWQHVFEIVGPERSLCTLDKVLELH